MSEFTRSDDWDGSDSTDPMQVLRWELVLLWGDLAAAYRDSRATPPETSGGCENTIDRIRRVTRVVGPIPPEHVEMPFLLTGMYEKVHAAAGITVVVPEDLLARCRDRAVAERPLYARGGFIPSPPAATADQPLAWFSHPPAWPAHPHVPLGSALVRERDSGRVLRYDGGQWSEVPPEEWPGTAGEECGT